MPIPILPDAPSRTDPTNFSSKADAWVAALDPWTTAANQLEQSLQLVATTGTSTTSKTIANGSWTLTTQTGKAWSIGAYLYFASSSDVSKVMTGQVTAYNSGTGSLTVNITVVRGSGTYADWVIGLAVPDQAALNLSGGASGSLPYQSSANTTAMLSPGTAGQILQSGGSSAPSWVDNTGRLLRTLIFTTGTSTYTPSANATFAIAELVGAGGGGGGCGTSGAGQRTMGGSAGAGAYGRVRMTNLSLGTCTVIVGAGGNGGSNIGGNGISGGDTSISWSSGGSVKSAGGSYGSGFGSTFSDSNLVLRAGNLGGSFSVISPTGFSTLFSSKGGAGETGMCLGSAYALVASGGKSFFGIGGESYPATGGSSIGLPGVGYGDGGGGAFAGNGAGQMGGLGMDGIVIIYEYS